MTPFLVALSANLALGFAPVAALARWNRRTPHACERRFRYPQIFTAANLATLRTPAIIYATPTTDTDTEGLI